MGRIRRDVQHKTTQEILDGSAPDAAALLRDVVTGITKRIGPARQRAAEFVIEHSIGRPQQKITMRHTGTPLTYEALAKSAEDKIKAMKEAGLEMPDVIKQAEAVAAQAEAEQDEEDRPGEVHTCPCGAEFDKGKKLRHHQAVCPVFKGKGQESTIEGQNGVESDQ